MDNMDQHIRNFYIRVNESVDHILRGETVPLVLAGVEHQASMYRDIIQYPHVAQGWVHGSPDSLRGVDLLSRALEIAKPAFEEPMMKALQTFERLGGSERVTHKPAEIVKVSHESRIAHLFLAEGAQHPGGWDRATMQVTSEGAGEDLLNIAALQTLSHGGEVWITSQDRIPGGGPAAALLRF
jgi:hypothetical protein